MVGAEEGVEAQVLGRARHGEEVVVARALLRFGEDAEVHAPSLPQSSDVSLPEVVGAVRSPGPGGGMTV
ncbi:hypothetical protein GCM10010972_21200 [Cellulomonas carbonis]|nr:hypothetical protein GCM10010972_21200 [Cellulomonas carbonis]